MFLRSILPISIILIAGLIGFWHYQNPCVETVDSTYQNGWQGENSFSVKIERIPETCAFGAAFSGAKYIFSARQGDSEAWRQIISVHNDDRVDISNDSIKIINENVAYIFMDGDYAATSDSGKTWKLWSVDKIPNWNFSDYGYIKEVKLSETGIGWLKLNPLEKHKDIPEFYTSDFGKNWKQTK